ncbi:MAG: Verru_Chthon cassette protein D [Fimbriimonadaceae bacterium]
MNVFAQRREISPICGSWHLGGTTRSRCSRAAFSLVEMLAVIGVIGLIAATTTPMLFSTMKANRLTAAGEEMVNRISLAQQMAVSRNHEVELRFYHFADPEDTTAGDHYRASLIVEPAPDPDAPTAIAYKVLSEMSYLRGGIVIANDPNLSPPFAESSRDDNADTDAYVRNAAAKYKTIRFFPDGSCDLTVVTNEAYMTVVDAREFENAKAIPKNFFAIQVDHYTSRVTPYRP